MLYTQIFQKTLYFLLMCQDKKTFNMVVKVFKFNRSVLSMKIILVMLAIVITTSFAISVQGCTNIENGQITGGACSIKELQNLSENNSLNDKEIKVFPYQKRDLVPFEQDNELFPDDCFFGKCLYKQILKHSSNQK